ncbi:MAG: hypothetical protein KJ880_00275 [Candidatus Omnitrophica bacterium]|nr:hypothetical protein [Candidatus Omnitrophota bacterium]MBU1870454.1 hypothetical protein [Candidatus Omnitrophota bacterium]
MEKQRTKSFDRLLEEEVLGMERVLFRPDIDLAWKRIIIMTLARLSSETALTALTRYCFSPDKELEGFAKMALEECLMWNE